MSYYGTLFLLDAIKKGQLAPASRIPMAIAYAALPVGFVMVLIRFYLDKKAPRPGEDRGTDL